MIEPIFIKENSLLLKKAEHFIGKDRFERIGMLKFSIYLFDSKMHDNRVDDRIYEMIEILYSEFVSQFNTQYVIAICEEFDLIKYDEEIPEYNMIVKANINKDDIIIGASFEEYKKCVLKDFIIKFERIIKNGY